MVDIASPDKLTHDRYLIYRMLGQQVSFVLHKHGRDTRKVNGIIERVCRDIFENMIEITVNGRLFQFKEPNVIALAPGSQCVIMFVYGKPTSESDMSDKALFAEVRASLFKGETINDVISRTTPNKTRIMRFTLAPPRHK